MVTGNLHKPVLPPAAGHANDVLQASTTASDFIDFPINITTEDFDIDSILNGSLNNATINGTLGLGGDGEPLYDVILMGVTSVFLGLMILITVIGNVFVIAAILLERNLQNVANYLIVSLAVADLMVACLVMPLGAVYEISNGWVLGPEVCDMWTSSDVLCCTASILHLVAIAVDRYWAVTNVDYIHTRNGTRIVFMIVVVWSVALIVALAPQFGWKDAGYLDRINLEQKCLPSQDIGYQIFATCSTFYVPLLVILILYWKIFQTARKRIHRRRDQRPAIPDPGTNKTNNNSTKQLSKNFLTKRKFLRMKKCTSKKKSSATEALVSSLNMAEGQSTTTVDVIEEIDENDKQGEGEETTAFTISKGDMANTAPNTLQQNSQHAAISNNVSPEKSSATTTNNGSASHQSHISDISRVEILAKESGGGGGGGGGTQVDVTAVTTAEKQLPSHHQRRDKKESLEAKRERKAAKTLAIITGAFVMCWLPFFVTALVLPLCSSCIINDYVLSIFLWLGYFNSTLNPVIYTIFSPEFRQAFTRILCGSKRARRHNFRSGKVR